MKEMSRIIAMLKLMAEECRDSSRLPESNAELDDAANSQLQHNDVLAVLEFDSDQDQEWIEQPARAA